MPALVVDEEAILAAERRLGRRLRGGERLLDLRGNAAELDDAKARLRDAIEEEKRRVIGAVVRGRGRETLALTPAMEAVLLDLHDAGARAAREEIDRMGVDLPRALARKPKSILDLLGRLRTHLKGISVRVNRESVSAGIGERASAGLIRTIDRRVPGALDAASRLVSSAFTSGIASVYENAEALFSGWIYSAAGDAAVCDECETHDGEEYATLEEAYEFLPDFGPNPDCYGNGRCRCRLVPLGADEGDAGDVAAPDSGGDTAPVDTDPGYTPAPLRDVGHFEDVAAAIPRQETREGGDLRLAEVYKRQGFDRLPHVVDETELDDAIAAGERELFRGLNAGQTSEQEFLDAFREGEHFAGFGVYGNGTYTATPSAASDAARRMAHYVSKHYADGDEGRILRMSLRRDARLISIDEVQSLMYANDRKLAKLAGEALEASHTGDTAAAAEFERLSDLRDLYLDEGRLAAMLGYDGIEVGTPGGSPTSYVVVLNRSAVRVQRTAATPPA